MMKRITTLILTSFFLWMQGIALAASDITQIRASGDAQKTRLVISFDQAFDYNIFTLDYPTRLVIDVEQGSLPANLRQVLFHKTLFKSMRSGKRADGTLRLVFELKTPIHFSTFELKPSADNQSYRLVADLKKEHSQLKVQEVIRQVVKPTISIPKKTTLRDVIVVIDPGHGGKDPGAIGASGTKEKNVVLAIAKQLQAKLNREQHIRAYLTRKGDYYIGLRKRLGLTREKNADIFISIHADAFHKRHSNGASVFALSQRGASSEAARWLAERENHSELGTASLHDKSYILRSVLLDLSQTATISDSLILGGDVLKNLGSMTRLHNRKVEQAGFVVLKSPDIPSILIETGFISNHREESLLRSSQYRERLANAITQGVKRYFWHRAPSGTWISEQRKARHYKVSRGDNLGEIATRFHVSVASLKQFNQLATNRIRVGQVLSIPKSDDS